MNKNDKQKRWHTCDVCKKTKADVEWCVDPYLQELYNDTVECYLCADCYQNKLDEI